MKKNVASQSIGCQMVNASDGSAFTSAVTIRVTGDNGTQTTGSVGSGACTHEGNGYHSYGPAQAETNFDHIAFTFTGTGAVPATVQVFTGFPQTGDNFARLGAPATTTVSADIAVVAGYLDTEVGDIRARLPAALTGAGNMKVDVLALNGSTTSAVLAAAVFDQAIFATVSNAAFSPISTEFECADYTEVTGQHVRGKTVYARTGNLAKSTGQVVLSYALSGGGRGHFITSGSPTGESFANGDTLLFV